MGRRYRNPPVVEAVCEFRFDPGPWDLTIPGLVYDELAPDFPDRDAAPSVLLASGEVTIQQLVPDRIRFKKRDGTASVQLGPHVLAVSHFPPYPTWESFRPLIRRVLDVYRTKATPAGIQRIGLRYINHVEFPGLRLDMEDFFDFYPFLGAGLPQDYFAFILGVQYLFEEQRDVLRLQVSNATSKAAENIALQLDLDYFLNVAGEIAFENVDEWLEQAHHHVEDAFEASLKDKIRTHFAVEG